MFTRIVSMYGICCNMRPRIKLLPLCSKSYSTDTMENKLPKKSGYAEVFESFKNIGDGHGFNQQTFSKLLRNSPLMEMGDPEGKVVIGKIFHVVNDDLYIDFGWKFYCICPRPKNNASNYIRGANVRLQIKDLELSSKFIGFEKDLTLLEADCQLIGLQEDRGASIQNVKN